MEVTAPEEIAQKASWNGVSASYGWTACRQTVFASLGVTESSVRGADDIFASDEGDG